MHLSCDVTFVEYRPFSCISPTQQSSSPIKSTFFICLPPPPSGDHTYVPSPSTPTPPTFDSVPAPSPTPALDSAPPTYILAITHVYTCRTTVPSDHPSIPTSSVNPDAVVFTDSDIVDELPTSSR